MAPQPKTTPDQQAEIARKWFSKEASQRELSYMYDISLSSVSAIIFRAKMDRKAESLSR